MPSIIILLPNLSPSLKPETEKFFTELEAVKEEMEARI